MRIDEKREARYNIVMNEQKSNLSQRIAKYIRIALSLAIIVLGIIYKNPVGILGLLTLYTAFTGTCGTFIRLPRRRGYHSDE